MLWTPYLPKKIKNFSPSTCHRCWWPFWGVHRKYQKRKHSPLPRVLPGHWYRLILVSIMRTCSKIEYKLNIVNGYQNNTSVVKYCDNQWYRLCSKINLLWLTSSAALVSPSTRLSADWKLPKSGRLKKGWLPGKRFVLIFLKQFMKSTIHDSLKKIQYEISFFRPDIREEFVNQRFVSL